jgi:hypothetical protein
MGHEETIFGEIKLPAAIEHDKLLIKISKNKSSIRYHRQLDGESIDKILSLKQNNQLIINSIEPTNTP